MANVFYNNAKALLQNGGMDLDTDTIKCALMTSAYTANADSDLYWTAVSANEATGTGYTAGGATLGTVVVSADNTNDRAYFDAADVTWSSSTITARGAVLYDDSKSGKPVIAYIDFSSNQSSSSGNFTIAWTAPASGGIFYLS